MNEIKNLILGGMSLVYEENKINLLWCLVGNYKKYRQFYIITDIIYI